MLRTSALLLAAAAAAPLSAQTAVRAGASVSGALAAGDSLLDGVPYDTYRVTGRPGARMIVVVRSAAFDPVLVSGRVQGGAWEPVDFNDDGSVTTNPRLALVLPESGVQPVRVMGFEGSELGAYEIAAAEDDALFAAASIAEGETVSGTLAPGDFNGDGGLEDRILVRGQPGGRYVLVVESADFDVYGTVGVWGPEGYDVINTDDYGEGREPARIVTLVEGGETVVLGVSAFDGTGQGRYTVRMEADPRGGDGGPGEVPPAR